MVDPAIFVFRVRKEVSHMSYGILLLRAIVGLTMAGHGLQKLFGWFGGPGPKGTAGMFRTLGFPAAALMAVLAGLAETGGPAFRRRAPDAACRTRRRGRDAERDRVGALEERL